MARIGHKNGKRHGPTIGTLLKAARLRQHLSADEVAAACEVSRSRVYQWEAATHIFPGSEARNFRNLSKVLHIPVTRLRDANGRRV